MNFSHRKIGTLSQICISAIGLISGVYAEEGAIPKSFPLERYQTLLGKSPFAVATAPPEPTGPVENFATNWVVTGLSSKRAADGSVIYTAFIRSRDLSTRMVLTGDKPNADGVSIDKVEEAPIAAKSVVFVKKGAEIGKVEFDQAAISAGPAPVASGAPVNKGQTGAPTPVKAAPNRAPIPRPGISNQPKVSTPQAAPAAPTGTAEPRRRVRAVEEPP